MIHELRGVDGWEGAYETWLSCDRCDMEGEHVVWVEVDENKLETARYVAVGAAGPDGWHAEGDKDYCPACAAFRVDLRRVVRERLGALRARGVLEGQP